CSELACTSHMVCCPVEVCFWQRTLPHSTQFSGGVCPHSSKAARGEDLQVEHPVWCGDAPAFHFHATLAGMLRPTLIGDQVIEVRQPCQTRLLAATGWVKPFHRKQFALHSVMSLIQKRAGRWLRRVFEDGIPAGFLPLKPTPDTPPVSRPRHGGDVVGKVA